jgi:glycosyltransferase involved in cell wall biosynthesis
MKIALIAPTYLPARRANTIQVMKMAQALATLGHDLLVLVPGRIQGQSPSWNELAHHYGLRQRFEIEWVSTNPHLRSYDYGLKAIQLAREWDADLIYTRLPQAATLSSFMGIPTVYEVHDLPQGTLGPWLLARFLKGRGARALIVITEALKDGLVSKFSLPDNLPLIVAPDGVDLARYQNLPSPSKARQLLSSPLHISPSTFVAGYTGHLYPGRGSDLILEIAAQLADITFLLVGGEPENVERVRQQVQSRELENIYLTGFVPNADLPLYQAACDMLLMPYQKQVSASSGGDIARYLSPMKLFEYLACGRCIISSNLPVLREVLNNDNSVLLPPDDLDAWVTSILELRRNSEKRNQLAIQAKRDSQEYSWEKRAEGILSQITFPDS